MNRRQILAAAATTCSGLLAGCVSNGDGSQEDNKNSDGSTEDYGSDKERGQNENKTTGQNQTEIEKQNDETKNNNSSEDEQRDSEDNDSTGGVNTNLGEGINEADIRTTDTGCGGGIESSDWKVDSDAIIISGTREASSPCYRAILKSVAKEENTVQATIALKPTQRECRDCVGSVQYVATIRVDDISQVENVETVYN